MTTATPNSPPLALRRLAWTALAWNVLVICWGAVVRATGSGAGCGNHWPLCNGQIIPIAPRLATIIEFTHRCMTAGSVFLVLGVLIGAFLYTPKGHRARLFAVLSAILLVNEALLGALLVKLGYVTTNRSIGRVIVLSIHLSNTLLLVAALTLTAAVLHWNLARTHIIAKPSTRWTIYAGLALTILTGVTGSLAALGDTLFPSATLAQSMAQDFSSASPWLLRLRWVHPTGALLVGAFIFWIVGAAIHRSYKLSDYSAHRLRLAAHAVSVLLLFQLILGVGDVLLLAPTYMQILHLLGANLFWIALILLSASLLTEIPAAKTAV